MSIARLHGSIDLVMRFKTSFTTNDFVFGSFVILFEFYMNVVYMLLGHLSGDISAYVMKAKSLLMTRHALEFLALKMVIRCDNVVML